MSFRTEGKVEPRYVAKANEIFGKYLHGHIHPKKTYGKGYKVLEVGKSHRLLCVNGDWSLMTHAKYNRLVDRVK